MSNTRSATLGRQLKSFERRFAVVADAPEFRHLASQVSLSSMPEICPQLISDENETCAFTYQLFKYTTIEVPLLLSTVPQLLVVVL